MPLLSTLAARDYAEADRLARAWFDAATAGDRPWPTRAETAAIVRAHDAAVDDDVDPLDAMPEVGALIVAADAGRFA